jgi:GcvH upstream region-like protein
MLMLSFFRRCQRPFFIFITVIVIVSMTFFGTYYGFRGPGKADDPVVFTAMDGTTFTRQQMAQMSLFLGSDAVDKLQAGGIAGPNFLNDGVIRNDLLQSGLATMLAAEYSEILKPDFKLRGDRERSYQPYVHAQAGFLTAESAWSHYAPQLLEYYKGLKSGDQLSEEGLANRIGLYLEEQRFPQTALKQVLRYQESQYEWIPQDPYLYGQDLSLFGYHTLEDWFGPRFLALSTEFIINASIIAEQQGYTVGKEEARAELRRNAEISFQANRQSPYLDVNRVSDYMDEQLQQMGLDMGTATAMWRRVMLFRRLFDDVGHAALVDLFSFRKFSEYSDLLAEMEVYQLADGLHLNDYHGLQAFECYLDAVAERDAEQPLALPTQFKPFDVIKEEAPELVQRRYYLGVAEAHQGAVMLRLPVKALWEWQLAEENWAAIAEQFPTLRTKTLESREERFAAIRSLERPMRRRLDSWSQEQIVKLHPEWIAEALDEVEPHEMEVGITLAGGLLPLAGIEDRERLLELLDAAVEAEESPLWNYTENYQIFYRIEVLERSEQEEILTFSEALRTNALEPVIERRLGERGFRRDEAADKEFAQVIEAAYLEAVALEPWDTELPAKATGDYAAKHRFCGHLKTARADFMEHGDESMWLKQESTAANTRLAQRAPLTEQWKLEQQSITLQRQGYQEYGQSMPYEMADASWSEIFEEEHKPGYFFYLANKTPGQLVAGDQVDLGQQALAADAQRCYMRAMLDTMAEQQAISLVGMFPEEG